MTRSWKVGREAARRAAVSALTRLVAVQRPVERACYLIGAALMVSGLVHLGVAAIDSRPWLGPLSWRKPASFGASFGITLIAVTWVSSYLRLSPRTRARLLGLFATESVIEVVGITVQAWRHVPSHFNTETPFDAIIAYSLAAGGAGLVVVLGSFSVTALRGRIDASPSMRIALRTGFGLLLAGLAAGIAMIVRGETLIKTGHRAAAYETAGYLKWFHGVGLLAIIVLPALAWWLSRNHQSEARRTTIVTAAARGYMLLAGATLIVSLSTS